MKRSETINLFLSGCAVGNLVTVWVISGLVMFCALTVSCAAGGKEAGGVGYPASTGTGKGVSMRVLWSVSAYHIGENAAWGEKEARAMLFKPLDMTSSSIIFDGRTCRDVVFKKDTVATEAYFKKKYKITLQALGLEEKTVQVVKTNCRFPGFSEYIRLKDGRLIVPMHGILFIFTPAVTY